MGANCTCGQAPRRAPPRQCWRQASQASASSQGEALEAKAQAHWGSQGQGQGQAPGQAHWGSQSQSQGQAPGKTQPCIRSRSGIHRLAARKDRPVRSPLRELFRSMARAQGNLHAYSQCGYRQVSSLRRVGLGGLGALFRFAPGNDLPCECALGSQGPNVCLAHFCRLAPGNDWPSECAPGSRGPNVCVLLFWFALHLAFFRIAPGSVWPCERALGIMLGHLRIAAGNAYCV